MSARVTKSGALNSHKPARELQSRMSSEHCLTALEQGFSDTRQPKERGTRAWGLGLEVATAYHVGALESSKSAMKTEAPELRALMTILRSTGPVISTLLSCRSWGSFPTCMQVLESIWVHLHM